DLVGAPGVGVAVGAHASADFKLDGFGAGGGDAAQVDIHLFFGGGVAAGAGEIDRDLETLVDDVYIANYKLSGQAFWCPVAYVEQSLFDLLGRTERKPAGEL